MMLRIAATISYGSIWLIHTCIRIVSLPPRMIPWMATTLASARASTSGKYTQNVDPFPARCTGALIESRRTAIGENGTEPEGPVLFHEGSCTTTSSIRCR